MSLSDKNRQVFFFESRLEFLVCATVFDNPYLIIDAMHETAEDIRWIYSRLTTRGKGDCTYFISPVRFATSSYMGALSIITNIKDLKKICDQAGRFTVADRAYRLKVELYESLSKKLSISHLKFLMAIYNPMSHQYYCKNKKDFNKILYLRKRLLLGSAIEMKLLISILTSKSC